MKKSNLLFFGIAIWIMAEAIIDFFTISWGTGFWLGEFSLKWGLGFAVFTLFLISLLVFLWFFLWRRDVLQPFIEHIILLRQKLKHFSWVFVLVFLILTLWFFQYTIWGLIFTDIYFRLFIWGLITIVLAILLTQDEEKIISFPSFLVGTLLSSTSFTLASVFSNAVDYPFNLYWSDGNRLWDYSIMFGRHLYNYPADQPLNAFISSGRQILWGLPFLFPNTTILINRFWSAFLLSFPYMLLGWTVFKVPKGKRWEWLFIGFWTFLFLNQGPIYTPLILSAILVAMAWERPLWIAIPLVVFAGYYAKITRWTWVYASVIWAGMLFLNSFKLKDMSLSLRIWWTRIIALAIAGGSILYLYPIIQKSWVSRSNPITGLGNALKGEIISIQGVVTAQPLLWSRLFPSDTYPEGILGGLLIAILPLIILLIYWLKKKYWKPSFWQKLTIIGSLLAFLVVGIIISTKIGGGNNLHNLDMFLIALLFVTAIAWKNGGDKWFAKIAEQNLWMKIILVLIIALPAYPSLRGLEPNLSLTPTEIEQVKILRDAEYANTLPSVEKINDAIWYIRHAINDNKEKGEILFIDQRQLLTFGYVPKIPLLPEYEKKRMMNEAMSSNATYFAPYYEDLANNRFSLIISEPLKVYIKNEEGVFAEENDLWTIWVAAPTLCYYEPLVTLRDVYIQLLVPREEDVDCSDFTP